MKTSSTSDLNLKLVYPLFFCSFFFYKTHTVELTPNSRPTALYGPDMGRYVNDVCTCCHVVLCTRIVGGGNDESNDIQHR